MMEMVMSHLPALQAEPFEFRRVPSPECLLVLLMLEWPVNSFEPKLQSINKLKVRNYKNKRPWQIRLTVNQQSFSINIVHLNQYPQCLNPIIL